MASAFPSDTSLCLQCGGMSVYVLTHLTYIFYICLFSQEPSLFFLIYNNDLVTPISPDGGGEGAGHQSPGAAV